jgi:hypothetical protein
MIENLKVDVLTWYADVIGINAHGIPAILVYLLQAIGFYRLCRDYVARHFPNLKQVKITGHSLGGAVAQLMALQAGYGVPIVAINSPGCGHLPGVKKQQALWVQNINSRYGIINKVGLTLGHLFAIDVPNRENEAKELCRDFNQALYQEAHQHFAKASGADFVNQASEYSKGTWAALKLYASAFAKFETSPAVREQYLKCLSPGDQQLWSPTRTIDLEMCVGSVASIEPGKVIYAQHAIDNVIRALHLPQNLGIANRNV